MYSARLSPHFCAKDVGTSFNQCINVSIHQSGVDVSIYQYINQVLKEIVVIIIIIYIVIIIII
jgi:hypothetical protein